LISPSSHFHKKKNITTDTAVKILKSQKTLIINGGEEMKRVLGQGFRALETVENRQGDSVSPFLFRMHVIS